MIKPNSIRNQCWVYRDEYRVIGKGSLQFARSNDYPYNEHVRDCDICLAAQAVGSLQAEVEKHDYQLGKTVDYKNQQIKSLQSEIRRLKKQSTEKDDE
jgi:hypothetical protein